MSRARRARPWCALSSDTSRSCTPGGEWGVAHTWGSLGGAAGVGRAREERGRVPGGWRDGDSRASGLDAGWHVQSGASSQITKPSAPRAWIRSSWGLAAAAASAGAGRAAGLAAGRKGDPAAPARVGDDAAAGAAARDDAVSAGAAAEAVAAPGPAPGPAAVRAGAGAGAGLAPPGAAGRADGGGGASAFTSTSIQPGPRSSLGRAMLRGGTGALQQREQALIRSAGSRQDRTPGSSNCVSCL